MSTYLPLELRQQLEEVDDHQCAYCQTTQGNTGQPMVLDHIMPEVKGGKTEFANLCFASQRCNEFKGSTIQLGEPVTDEIVSLFHPRRHRWSDHFVWDGQKIHLTGLTPMGRVTIIALNMNNELIVDSRRRWASVGWHPPDHE